MRGGAFGKFISRRLNGIPQMGLGYRYNIFFGGAFGQQIARRLGLSLILNMDATFDAVRVGTVLASGHLCPEARTFSLVWRFLSLILF